jgi:hypothetical protein
MMEWHDIFIDIVNFEVSWRMSVSNVNKLPIKSNDINHRHLSHMEALIVKH